MNWIKNGALVSAGILFALLLLEGGLRLTGVKPPSGAENVVGYDEKLGWAPIPGSSGTDQHGNPVTILADGTRSNGAPVPLSTVGRVLAVGDSFVFGDEVADTESWPAQLERRLGRQVINGGVNGYGLDQAVLRAKDLIVRHRPEILVFSVFPDDIPRCGLSQRHRPKPFFELLPGERVALRNVPVPVVRDGWWQWLKKASALAQRIGGLIDPPDMAVAHQEHEHVAALLLQELAEFGRAQGVEVLLLLQYNDLAESQREMVNRVLYFVRRAATARIVDLYPLQRQIRERSVDEYARLFITFDYKGERRIRHMNATGNAFVAGVMAAELKRVSGASPLP